MIRIKFYMFLSNIKNLAKGGVSIFSQRSEKEALYCTMKRRQSNFNAEYVGGICEGLHSFMKGSLIFLFLLEGIGGFCEGVQWFKEVLLILFFCEGAPWYKEVLLILLFCEGAPWYKEVLLILKYFILFYLCIVVVFYIILVYANRNNSLLIWATPKWGNELDIFNSLREGAAKMKGIMQKIYANEIYANEINNDSANNNYNKELNRNEQVLSSYKRRGKANALFFIDSNRNNIPGKVRFYN